MPKSLHIHSNERIDLPDFELAANGYSHSLRSHQIAKAMLDKHSRVLSGFRIELADQATSPGQLTVLAGLAYDKSGAILDIEDQPDASLTTTLAGASQTFYLEVEFTESASDLDSRGFWDPTVDQTSPIPDGGEVLVSVSTRKTPSWKIVSPISTTGFTYLSLPNSTRIPIAVLNTDASNQIDPSVNLFSSLEYPSTVTVADYIATDTVLSVVDSHLFPIGSVITVDLGGTSPEVGRTVINNDLDNHVITVSPALATSHLAGAIIRRTDAGTDTLVPEQTDPNAAAYAAVTPATRPNDYRKRFFGGDELRGSGLLKSAKTFGTRDDLKIKNEKDHNDFIAALLRDLKFGSPRADTNLNTPPVAFSSTPRYFDSAGSISGAKNNTISIGNGTTTYGDLNGTTDAVFTAAVAFLATNGGGTVYIKKGTYVFTNQITIPDGLSIEFKGESRTGVILANNRAATSAFVVSDSGGLTSVTFENVSGVQTGGSLIFLSGIGSYALTIVNSYIPGISTLAVNKLLIDNSGLSNTSTFTAVGEATITNSVVSLLATVSIEDFVCINTTIGQITASTSIGRSTFFGSVLGAITTPALVACMFESCTINDVITVSTSILDVSFSRCNSTVSFLPTKLLNVTGSSVDQLSLFNCRFSVIGNNIYSQASGTVTNISIQNCDFRSVSIPTQTVPLFDFANATVSSGLFSNTTFDSPMIAASPVTSALQFSTTWSVLIQGCNFNTGGSLGTNSTNVVRSVSVVASSNMAIRDCFFTQSSTTEYTQGIYSSGAADLLVDNCSFSNGYSGLTAINAVDTVDQIIVSNCEFNHSVAIDYAAVNVSGSQVLAASVLNSSFNYGGISGAGLVKQGVLFENIQSSLTVSNCNFTDFGLNSTAGTYGINVSPTAVDSTVHVYNNTFADFKAVTHMFAVRCVAAGTTVSVQHNTVTDFASTGTANGSISIFDAVNANVSNNSFTNVVLGDSGTNIGAAVTCTSCQNVKINSNNIYDCTNLYILSSLNTSNTDANIEISHNNINLNLASSTNIQMNGIICEGAAEVNCISICSNIITMIGTALANTGIVCGDAGGGRPRQVIVCDNNIQLLTGSLGIFIEAIHAVCSNNNIKVCNGFFATTGGPGISMYCGLGGTCTGNVVPGTGFTNITCTGVKIVMSNNLTNTLDSNTSTGTNDVNNI